MSLSNIVTVGKETEVHQLARQFGRKVFVADDLTELFDISKRVDPDLILFDHRFSPNCIRRFLSTTDENSDVPVVVVGSDENIICEAGKTIICWPKL